MTDRPQVALDFMNRYYAEFIALRKKLLALLARPAADTMVDALLEQILQHTCRHAANEISHSS